MKEQTNIGHIHPLTHVINDVAVIFTELGFSIARGPQIETEENNFDLLNIPDFHPARDMWDTFWLKGDMKTLLRTHTSPVQVRYMKEHTPPLRIVSPGKVYRYEATDATHEAQFYQFEGLMVDKKGEVTMAHLKGILEYFLSKFLGEKVEARFRPSFFPFVEPGVEVDVRFKGKWLELLGAGMVHPKVLSNVGINPEEYQGFAFGTGIDRLAMVKYGIPDVRLSYQGDLRFINQF